MQARNAAIPIHMQPGRAVTKFNIQSSDVLQDMRINVSAEGSDQVIWFKERFLTDEEIIEHVVHNPTSTICWIVHRPKRGWYIRLRSPTFPPGVFIPITPVPPASPHYVEAALTFSSRTNVGGAPVMSRGSTDASSIHSYPPTPPPVVVVVEPPSSTHDISDVDVNSVHQTTPKLNPSRRKPPPTQITHFILAPLSTAQSLSTVNQPRSFLTKAFSFLKQHSPHHSNSFTLTKLPPCKEPPLSPPPPYASESEESNANTLAVVNNPLDYPLLTFHDHTPVLTVGSITGLLEIDTEELCALGIDTSFWITIALSYLEFLEERESYLAAMND